MTHRNPIVLTTKEACVYLHISRETLRHLIKAGEVTAIKNGPNRNSHWRITVDSLDDYIRRHAVKAVSQ